MTNNYKSIELAFDSVKSKINVATGNPENIDLSDIATTIINNVGRFCEHYASDFIITWDTVRELVSTNKSGHDERDIICFALRKMGVDGNDFLMCRLKNHKDEPGWADLYYRKILALEIKKEVKPSMVPYLKTVDVTCTLKDITNAIEYKAE